MTATNVQQRAANESAPTLLLGRRRRTERAAADRWAIEVRRRTADENALQQQFRAKPPEADR